MFIFHPQSQKLIGLSRQGEIIVGDAASVANDPRFEWPSAQAAFEFLPKIVKVVDFFLKYLIRAIFCFFRTGTTFNVA